MLIKFFHKGWLALLILSVSHVLLAAQPSEITWPDNQQVAVSLSYDDGLNSHLDNAIPALNRYGFKASFYLTLASPVISARLSQWREAAKQGHELGNHSLFHGCAKNIDGREWVDEHLDLSKRTPGDVVSEIRLANDYLYAIDGKQKRTFTPPCNDVLVINDQPFLDALQDDFVAIKGNQHDLPESFNQLWAPADIRADQLIAYVEQQAGKGGVINIIFHGVGGDHLSVSLEAHNALLAYLDANKSRYWVESYLTIMEYVNGQNGH
ncbi:polysaccharide deacetylase [Thalassotalea litorea]|uniref:Polysaccharide deacetylase n=1 Tax=Thalassotalea litorea TaxID=2020715 RepID=A0A5R9IRG4_9GAMM|nr:polysaccharide deacetylase family protein [Thalassotalea litorea]TLU68114.1 polysaccharide deacetylase [Thalassotalea litorea]